MVPWKNNIWKVTQSFQVIWKSPKESSLQFLEEVCQILRELLVWSNACPLSHWCHPTILSSVVPFSFCLPSFPASGTFPMSWLFKWDGQSIGASALASVLPIKYSRLISFRIDWFYLLSVQGVLKSLLHYHNLKALVLWCSAFFMVQFSHLYMTTGKTTALTIQTFVSQVMSLLFNYAI